MFLGKKYFLAKELVDLMGINISNISMARKQLEERGDEVSIRKLGNATFIKDSPKIPQYLRDGLAAFSSKQDGLTSLTSMHDKLPSTFVKAEHPVSLDEWTKAGLVTGVLTISGKELWQFSEDFVKTVTGKIVYVLDDDDYVECTRRNLVDGGIQVAPNKWVTWYACY